MADDPIGTRYTVGSATLIKLGANHYWQIEPTKHSVYTLDAWLESKGADVSAMKRELPATPMKAADYDWCPFPTGNAKHRFGPTKICGYSWHGPVMSAQCEDCGYVWANH